jgi:septal ring factor EnvC (AmiA/AmiB activator)
MILFVTLFQDMQQEKAQLSETATRSSALWDQLQQLQNDSANQQTEIAKLKVQLEKANKQNEVGSLAIHVYFCFIF